MGFSLYVLQLWRMFKRENLFKRSMRSIHNINEKRKRVRVYLLMEEFQIMVITLLTPVSTQVQKQCLDVASSSKSCVTPPQHGSASHVSG